MTASALFSRWVTETREKILGAFRLAAAPPPVFAWTECPSCLHGVAVQCEARDLFGDGVDVECQICKTIIPLRMEIT